jgi:DNA-binding transcriptional MerR regulator
MRESGRMILSYKDAACPWSGPDSGVEGNIPPGGTGMTRTFTIRQLTKEFGVTARALRFYEEEDLIAPARRGQTRLYNARDRARIVLILRGRRVGFSLAELRELLDLYEGPGGNAGQMVEARRKFQERISVLERQKVDIEQSLTELRDGIQSIDAALGAQATH